MRMEPGGHLCTEPRSLGHWGLGMQPEGTCQTTLGHGKDIEFCSTSAGLWGRNEASCALWTLHSGYRGPAPTCRFPTPPAEAVLRDAWEAVQVFRGPLLRPFVWITFGWWAPSEGNSLPTGTKSWGAQSWWNAKGNSPTPGQEGGRRKYLHWVRARLARKLGKRENPSFPLWDQIGGGFPRGWQACAQ